MNLSGEKVNQIRDILFLIKQYNDFEAVGIRIKEKGFFPYYETNGFPANFVKEANKICKINFTDNSKNNFYGCMCGKIILGETNLDLPFFTKYGSFWTNDLINLLKENPNNIQEYFSLKNCIEEDYHSIAIIPIKTDSEIIGLLQINDKRRGIFSNKIIVTLETIASSVAIAFVRDESIKELEINERRYRLAQKAANNHGWTMVAGSDAHLPELIGSAYTVIEADDLTADEILENIRKGNCKPYGTVSSLWTKMKTYVKVRI